ncbi:lysostaphin resistance A-like protein [Halorubrum sp. DTA98]|uniref:CPBP family intramembrane glutamic endopeptidase n=1 Tax=Halorubrum sp. DTA98 TaxID=3402163 RepID=UPI003AABE4C1
MDPRSALRHALVTPSERRPRTPVRLLGGAVLLVIAVITAQVLVVLAIGPEFDPGAPFAFGVTTVATGIAVVLALVPIARFVDRRRLADYGFRIDREWWIDCGFGLWLGVALQAAVFAVGWAAGWFTVVDTFRAPGSFLLGFAGVVGLFLVVGVYEELLLRGWLLTNLAEGFRFAGRGVAVLIALVASSVLFGLLHAANPGATPLSIAVISLAGVLLAAGYLLTGELAVPIGLHVTWNLAQGGLFGHGVSGLGAEVTIVATETTGPAVWTGGGFGPEGGILGLLAVLVGCAAIAAWVRFRTGSLRIHPAVTTPMLRGGRSRAACDADDDDGR